LHYLASFHSIQNITTFTDINRSFSQSYFMSLANGLMRRLFYGSQMCVKDEESDMEMSSFDNEVNNMHIEEPPRLVIEKN